MSVFGRIQQGVVSAVNGLDVNELMDRCREHKTKIAAFAYSAGAYTTHQLLSATMSRSAEEYPSFAMGVQIALPLFAGLAGSWGSWYVLTKVPYLGISESRLVHKANCEIEKGGLSQKTCDEIFAYLVENPGFAKRLARFIESQQDGDYLYEQMQFFNQTIQYNLVFNKLSMALIHSYRSSEIRKTFHFDKTTNSKNKAETLELSFENLCSMLHFANVEVTDNFQTVKNSCAQIKTNLAKIDMGFKHIPDGTIMVPNKTRYLAYKSAMGFGDNVEDGFNPHISLACSRRYGSYNRVYSASKACFDDIMIEEEHYLTHDMYVIDVMELFDPLCRFVTDAVCDEDYEIDLLYRLSTNINAIAAMKASKIQHLRGLAFVFELVRLAIEETNNNLSEQLAIYLWKKNYKTKHLPWDGSYVIMDVLQSPFRKLDVRSITLEMLPKLPWLSKSQAQFGKLSGHISNS